MGGGIFPIEKLTTLSMLDRNRMKRSVRYWDKAGTEHGGVFTAGVLMHAMLDGVCWLTSPVNAGDCGATPRTVPLPATRPGG